MARISLIPQNKKVSTAISTAPLFAEHGILLLNPVPAPGAGKTAMQLLKQG
jgi:hypothetical protein